MPRLSREQQRDILLRANVGIRIVAKRAGIRYSTTLAQDVAEARAELRLDDPVLDALIAQKKRSGRPWGPWRTATYKSREAV